MRVTLLGTGTSTGVPVIGCDCRVCRSEDPRDTRFRCSALVEADGFCLVIDTGPDFRQQALRAQMWRVDAVLYTHSHFDHVAGLDDLRPFLFENPSPIPCYADAATAAALQRMYPYAWGGSDYPGVPQLRLVEVEGPFEVARRAVSDVKLTVTPVPVLHGTLPILGYRIGRFAYLTDTSAIPEASYALLEDLDVLVLDALRPTPHPTHFTFEEAVEVARRIGARQTVFIHMSHNALHTETNAALPEGVALGYDGMKLEIADRGVRIAE